jgi:tetratricopeptide (TPR) repeat protein
MKNRSVSRKTSGIVCAILIVSIGIWAQRPAADERLLAGFEKGIGSGKLTETEVPLRQFALTHPNDARAVELLGRLRLKQGKLSEALSLYRRVLTLDPKFTVAKVNYALGLLLAAEDELAAQVLRDIDPSDIKDPLSRLSYMQALMLSGNCEGALKVADVLPLAVKNGDALPIRASCYLQLGQTNNIDALVPLAKKAVTTNGDAVMKLADILIGAGQPRAAAQILDLAVTASPKNAGALLLLGKAEIYEKDFAHARAHLRRAAILQPESAEVWYLQGQLETEQGNTPAALRLLKKASLLAPASTEILGRLALTAIKVQRARDAVEAAEKLLALKPDDPDGLYLLGAASLQGGDLDKAQASLERFTALRPKDSRGCLALGLTLAAQKDQIEPARQQLRHCLEIDPANEEARYQLGLSYRAQGDLSQATKLLEEVVGASPNYAAALRDLGAVYLQSGDEIKARDILERAVTIDPSDPETHFQLSRLYNLIGQPDLAKKHLELFQKLRSPGGNPTK